MQHIVIEKPYKFIPPHRGNWWPSLIQRFHLIDRWLRKSHGLVEYECRELERLKQSLRGGHGVMLAPNHCNPADPIVMGVPAREAGTHVFGMGSWHLFNQDKFSSFALTKMGAFSVNREGIDRKAINTAIDILVEAKRPLIVFPEGSTTRTNDRIHHLLDGVAFIARAAAKKRAKTKGGGKVVVHPVAIKYLFQGDLEETLEPILSDIEHRLTWPFAKGVPVIERVTRIGKALLMLKELQYFGSPQNGGVHERSVALIDRLLSPLEEEWLDGQKEEGVIFRVKSLRLKIVPEMTLNGLPAAERDRRWQQLEDIYLAQQISSYPADYLDELPSVDRLLETVEKFEEDLTDQVGAHGPIKVVIEIGEPIEVSTARDRSAKIDPLMAKLQDELQGMLNRLARESPLYKSKTSPRPAP